MSCGDSPLWNHKSPLKVRSQLQAASGLLEVEMRWQSGCPSFSECSFIAELKNPVSDTEALDAFLWMPSMGHGSSPIRATRLGPTTWEFTEVFFIMPGHWEVVLQLKQNQRVSDEVRLDYTL
jgi:hypothetical protein